MIGKLEYRKKRRETIYAGLIAVKSFSGSSTKILTANYLQKKKTKQMLRMNTESTSTYLTRMISRFAFGTELLTNSKREMLSGGGFS